MLSLTASSCDGPTETRDLNDATPPEIKLTVTASSTAVGGVMVVAPGSRVVLTPPGGSAFIEATDDDGVSWVELLMDPKAACGDGDLGTVQIGGLAPANPVKRVEGEVTDTDAPGSLTAGVDINLLELDQGCTYEFRVSGKSANAATNPVESRSSQATLVLTLP